MDSRWAAHGSSDVKLDLSRLKGDILGGDTRYAIALEGPIGEGWLEAWNELQATSTVARRFEIDAANATARFACRSVDGTGIVFEALERLQALIGRANEIVAVRRAD